MEVVGQQNCAVIDDFIRMAQVRVHEVYGACLWQSSGCHFMAPS